jgi:hypothetical protein
MTTYSTPDEYRNFLKNKLNPFERFADLLTGKDDRQDFTNILLWHLLQAVAGIQFPDGTGGDSGPGNINITFPKLGVSQEDCMTGIAAVTTAEIQPRKMIDCRAAHRILLVVNNGFDQEITVKVIGNNTDNHDSAKEVYSFTILAGESGAYGFKFEDWMPYVACTVTPSANPTLGTVSAMVYKQEASQ